MSEEHEASAPEPIEPIVSDVPAQAVAQTEQAVPEQPDQSTPDAAGQPAPPTQAPVPQPAPPTQAPVPQPAAPTQAPVQPPQYTPEQPQYVQVQYAQTGYAHPPQPAKPSKGKTLGIIAMILGIIGAICAFIPLFNIVSFPLVIAGLVLGIVSLVKARGGQGPKGFGIAGIICSAAALIITIVMYIIFAAAAAVVGTATIDYLDENYESYNPSDSAAHGAIELRSVEWNEEDSGDLLVYLSVTLENTSSETIELISVELPLYDETGMQVVSAYGTAVNVAPGVFTVDAIAVKTEEQTLSFNEDELMVTTL